MAASAARLGAHGHAITAALAGLGNAKRTGGAEPIGAATGSISMKYRGVEYTITQGTRPDVWKWRLMVGKPEMLRMGEAATQTRAEIQVWKVIDRAFELQKSLPPSKGDPDGEPR